MILAFRRNTHIHFPELVLIVISIWSSQNVGLEMIPILKAGDSQADVLPEVICMSTRRGLRLGSKPTETKAIWLQCTSAKGFAAWKRRAPHFCTPAALILQGLHRAKAAVRLCYILFSLPLFCRAQWNTARWWERFLPNRITLGCDFSHCCATCCIRVSYRDGNELLVDMNLFKGRING